MRTQDVRAHCLCNIQPILICVTPVWCTHLRQQLKNRLAGVPTRMTVSDFLHKCGLLSLVVPGLSSHVPGVYAI